MTHAFFCTALRTTLVLGELLDELKRAVWKVSERVGAAAALKVRAHAPARSHTSHNPQTRAHVRHTTHRKLPFAHTYINTHTRTRTHQGAAAAAVRVRASHPGAALPPLEVCRRAVARCGPAIGLDELAAALHAELEGTSLLP